MELDSGFQQLEGSVAEIVPRAPEIGAVAGLQSGSRTLKQPWDSRAQQLRFPSQQTQGMAKKQLRQNGDEENSKNVSPFPRF